MNNKRFFSILLSIVMVLTLLYPVNVFAEDEEDVSYDEYVDNAGDNVVVDDDDYATDDVDYSGDSSVYDDADENVVTDNDDNDADNVENDETSVYGSDDDNVIVEDGGNVTDHAETDGNGVVAEADDDSDVHMLSSGKPAGDVEENPDDEPSMLGSAPTITKQPESLTAAAGTTVYFEVVASGENLSYQWELSKDGGENWANTTLSGAKTKKLKVPVTEGRNGFQFRCTVKGTDGRVTSDAATLTVGGIVITKQPESVTAAAGDTVYFEVEASGDIVSYQWLVSKDGGENWANTTLSGAKTKKLKVPVTAGRNGFQFKCTVTGAAESVTSDAATLTVGEGVTITKQPESVSAAVGDTVYFEVEASGDIVSYQWLVSKDGRETWANTTLSGAKTKKLKVPVTAGRNGFQFKCTVTGAAESVTSDAATLTVGEGVTITKQPESLNANPGDVVYFEVEASGEDLSYQWLVSKDGGATWGATTLSGAKTKKLKVGATSGRNGFQFKCTVTGLGGSATSDAATLTVSEMVAITTQPESQTAAAGETVYFEVEASGDVVSYKWEVSKDNGETWSDTTLSGAKTKKLKVPATEGRDGFQFRCTVAGASNTVISDAATLTIGAYVIDGVRYEKLTDTTCCVASYEGTATSLTIPETIKDTMTVTEIGEEAFMDNTTLASIDLPDTITVIRARAFKGCKSLSTMS